MFGRSFFAPLSAAVFAIVAGCPASNSRGVLGEACDGSTGTYLCRPEFVCAHDGTCQDPGSGVMGAAAEGAVCASSDDCGYGLVCGPTRKCIVGGVVSKGQVCTKNEDCQYALVCTAAGVCGSTGNGQAGQACLGAQDCAFGLDCAGDYLCKDPDDPEATGVAGPSDACAATGDCRLGLLCYLDGTCQAPELWAGSSCAASDAVEADPAEPFRIYFEIPGLSGVDEFYRLPFPNDIRIKNGRVDLSGHAAPDTPLAAGVVSAYLAAIEAEMDGFSTQGAAFVRFSKAPDFSTIALTGDAPNVFLVDITPASPGYGEGWPLSMYATTAEGKYICQNWLALKPTDGYPLRHRTTYALIVTSGITSSAGAALERDGDFALVMAADQPADPTASLAWEAYAPLRAYLADENITPVAPADQVMVAAVFSTMNPDGAMAGFRDKIRACQGADCDLLPDPTPANVSLATPIAGAQVLNGTIDLPVFQVGQAPYLLSGGQVEFDAQGLPLLQGSTAVRFTLTVPEGSPPVDGWPVVIFAHGTGGSTASMLENAVAETLASVDVTLDTASGTAHFAVLGIDGIHHGDRRTAGDPGPDILYFNFLNPQAAKYNGMQGAAENFQLVRMIEQIFATPLVVTGLAEPLKLDPGRILYFGHSQGTLTGPLFLAYSPAVMTAVLSGAGGNLIQSLLAKTEPINIAGATQLILADANVNRLHPMLNLFQLYFDPIDPTNYGGALSYDPRQVGLTDDDPPAPIMAGPKHVLMSYGRDDAFTPELTQIALARAIGLFQVSDHGSDCPCLDPDCDSVDGDGRHLDTCLVSGMASDETPVRENVWWAGQRRTGIMKMYLPDGYDGHFVLFEHPQGPRDYSTFLGSTQVDPDGVPSLLP